MAGLRRISSPLSDEAVAALRSGDEVLLSGVVYAARDAAHKRLYELLQSGKSLPLDLRGQVIYYVGPTPPRPGRVIGSAGPTTSYRMDRYTPALLAVGLKGMIGKGQRSREVIEAMKRHGAVYFGAIGGAGALIARHIREASVVAYEDLGPEAVRRLLVEDLPVVVINDATGGDLYVEGRTRYAESEPASAP